MNEALLNFNARDWENLLHGSIAVRDMLNWCSNILLEQSRLTASGVPMSDEFEHDAAEIWKKIRLRYSGGNI